MIGDSAADLERALDDPDPPRGIALLDPDGGARSTALGAERMARALRDPPSGGDQPLPAAGVFQRPTLSP